MIIPISHFSNSSIQCFDGPISVFSLYCYLVLILPYWYALLFLLFVSHLSYNIIHKNSFSTKVKSYNPPRRVSIIFCQVPNKLVSWHEVFLFFLMRGGIWDFVLQLLLKASMSPLIDVTTLSQREIRQLYQGVAS